MKVIAVKYAHNKLQHIFYFLVLVLLTVSMSGCFASQIPAEVKYTNGFSIETFSSNASLEYKNAEKSVSGRGLIMYCRPDQMRAVILSPFGSVVQEIYKSGRLVTIIDVANGIAFTGDESDLPTTGNFSGWRSINWLMDMEPPDSLRGNTIVERTNRFGQFEKVTFRNGLLISKSSSLDGTVTYGSFFTANGTVLPLEIQYETASKEKFVISLDEPEINIPFDGTTFVPNLANYRVYSLAVLK